MLRSVRPDRVSQAIVDQIKKAIFQEKIKIGDKLPTERQMMEQFFRCYIGGGAADRRQKVW